MGWKPSDDDTYSILKEAARIRRLIKKVKFQPVIDLIFENKKEFAEHLLRFFNDKRPVESGRPIFNRNQGFYQKAISLTSTEEVPYLLQVGYSGSIDKIIVPLEEATLHMTEESLFAWAFADYRLEHGI